MRCGVTFIGCAPYNKNMVTHYLRRLLAYFLGSSQSGPSSSGAFYTHNISVHINPLTIDNCFKTRFTKD